MRRAASGSRRQHQSTAASPRRARRRSRASPVAGQLSEAKNSAVPCGPPPPNEPKSFWAPWPTKRRPTTSRSSSSPYSTRRLLPGSRSGARPRCRGSSTSRARQPLQIDRDSSDTIPSWSRQCPGADFDSLLCVRRCRVGTPEHVDEVDRPVDLRQRANAGNAEHRVAVGRPHGDHVVALREQVAHHPVARPVGVREAPTRAIVLASFRISAGVRIRRAILRG